MGAVLGTLANVSWVSRFAFLCTYTFTFCSVCNIMKFA